MKNSTPEIWHIGLRHLNYKAIQKLVSITISMKLKSFILLEICRNYMFGRYQQEPSYKSPNWQVIKFLKFVHSDLGEPLFATRLR